MFGEFKLPFYKNLQNIGLRSRIGRYIQDVWGSHHQTYGKIRMIFRIDQQFHIITTYMKNNEPHYAKWFTEFSDIHEVIEKHERLKIIQRVASQYVTDIITHQITLLNQKTVQNGDLLEETQHPPA